MLERRGCWCQRVHGRAVAAPCRPVAEPRARQPARSVARPACTEGVVRAGRARDRQRCACPLVSRSWRRARLGFRSKLGGLKGDSLVVCFPADKARRMHRGSMRCACCACCPSLHCAAAGHLLDTLQLPAPLQPLPRIQTCQVGLHSQGGGRASHAPTAPPHCLPCLRPTLAVALHLKAAMGRSAAAATGGHAASTKGGGQQQQRQRVGVASADR